MDSDEETERDLIIFDIQAYNAPDRSDDDRAAIRAALQTNLAAMLEEMGTSAASDDFDSNDTGDGVILAFSPDFDSAALIVDFIPRVKKWLGEYNETAPTPARIALRAAIGRGGIKADTLAITSKGIVGQAINETARLLDSSELRSDLSRLPRRYLAAIVTDTWLENLRATNRLLAQNFRRIQTSLKDGQYQGHIYLFDALSKSSAAASSDLKAADGGRFAFLDDLGPHLYLSAFDAHIARRFGGSSRASAPTAGQLAVGLLLYDGVIVHCADPYRSSAARSTLKEFSEFVSEGRIKFLLSAAIGDVEHDYEKYLVERAAAYAQTGYGRTDVSSLEEPAYDDPNALAESVALLLAAPQNVKRGFSGTDAFRDALNRDLSETERIVTNSWPLQKLAHSNYTIHQLLHLQRVRDAGSAQSLVDLETVRRFLTRAEDLIAGDNFSRQSIVALLDDEMGAREELRPLLVMIEARLNLLYVRTCCGIHVHTEVTKLREERGPLNHTALLRHLTTVSDYPRTVGKLSAAQVRGLLESKNWHLFAAHHMRCMSELIAMRMADTPLNDVEGFFRRRQPMIAEAIDADEVRSILGDVNG